MSSALAIAGVTAVLRDLLNDGIVNNNVSGVLGSTVTVSALPPDRVVPAAGAESTQLNVFLYHVTPNAAYRNAELPSRDGRGTGRLSNPPLALDLHYLVSAYGAEDLHAEILLGYAMQLLHEHAVLTPAEIRAALSPSPDVGTTLPPALRALASSGLADQLERVRITPQTMSSEEMSRVWTAMQTSYRPTALYVASVVLIEAAAATVRPLPVLQRAIAVSPTLVPPLPTIDRVDGLGGRGEMRIGDTVTLRGAHLDGTAREVLLENDRFAIAETIVAEPGAEASEVRFTIPLARSADFPTGVYHLSVRLVPTGATRPRVTNLAALVIRPSILALPMNAARDAAGTVTLALAVTPHARPGQRVSLFLGARETAPDPFPATTNVLTFTVPGAAVGNHLVRLRVDGIESEIVDRSAAPPVFLDERVNVT